MISFQQLAGSINGEIVMPGDAGYDALRRVWNHDIDLKPAAIVLCKSADDVASTIQFAHKNDFPVAVRSGGHSFAGHGVCDNGIVVNLSNMRRLQIDVPARLVTIEPGVRAGELDQVAQAFGLAVPLGSCPTVGVAGFALSGGNGSLTTKFGFACDSLVRARVISADADIITADQDHNPDLFWALRGGGGNFGIVTSLEFRLHHVENVLSGHLTYPISRIKEILHFLDEYVQSIPDELYIIATVMPRPGERMIDIAVVWSGNPEEGEMILSPLRSFAQPTEDSIRAKRYLEEQQSGSDSPGHGDWASYRRAGHLPRLTAEVLDVIGDFARGGPTENCGVSMIYWHGRWCARDYDNAFGFRRVGYEYWVHSYWQDPNKREKSYRWVDDFHALLQAHASSAVYVNDLGRESAERVRNAYGSKYERLAQIKAKYDPDNFFHINQNIEPEGSTRSASL